MIIRTESSCVRLEYPPDSREKVGLDHHALPCAYTLLATLYLCTETCKARNYLDAGDEPHWSVVTSVATTHPTRRF